MIFAREPFNLLNLPFSPQSEFDAHISALRDEHAAAAAAWEKSAAAAQVSAAAEAGTLFDSEMKNIHNHPLRFGNDLVDTFSVSETNMRASCW